MGTDGWRSWVRRSRVCGCRQGSKLVERSWLVGTQIVCRRSEVNRSLRSTGTLRLCATPRLAAAKASGGHRMARPNRPPTSATASKSSFNGCRSRSRVPPPVFRAVQSASGQVSGGEIWGVRRLVHLAFSRARVIAVTTHRFAAPVLKTKVQFTFFPVRTAQRLWEPAERCAAPPARQLQPTPRRWRIRGRIPE